MRLLVLGEGNVCVSDRAASREWGGAVHKAANFWDGVSRRVVTGPVYWCVQDKEADSGREGKKKHEPQSQALG